MPQILIIGAGIAGLWTFHLLKSKGYDVLLLERDGIGGGQTLASQGILHSGLKFAFAGKINDLAKNISAMPDRWRAALDGSGDVDLSAAQMNTGSQLLLMQKSLMSGVVKMVTSKALGDAVKELSKDEIPQDLIKGGFNGQAIFMAEPVLDIPSVIRALAEPYKNCIKKIDGSVDDFIAAHNLNPQMIINTAAESNHEIAAARNDDKGLNTQARPLLQGLMKPAPFPLYAHMLSSSFTDRPLASITTHKCADGTLCWYVGATPAEREKDANPQEVIDACMKAFSKFLPDIDFSSMQWATYPVDRIEGKSHTKGWMPDTPTIHRVDNRLYCWPTKLTFAPLLGDQILKEIDFEPSGTQGDYAHLQGVDYAAAPWDKVTWKNY